MAHSISRCVYGYDDIALSYPDTKVSFVICRSGPIKYKYKLAADGDEGYLIYGLHMQRMQFNVTVTQHQHHFCTIWTWAPDFRRNSGAFRSFFGSTWHGSHWVFWVDYVWMGKRQISPLQCHLRWFAANNQMCTVIKQYFLMLLLWCECKCLGVLTWFSWHQWSVHKGGYYIYIDVPAHLISSTSSRYSSKTHSSDDDWWWRSVVSRHQVSQNPQNCQNWISRWWN